MLQQLNIDVLSARQGEVSITPLDAPNALLLIGRKEAIAGLKELIEKIDQPIAESNRLRIFRLQNASAVDAKVKQLDASLYDGSVGGAKALEALQHEIAHLKEYQRGLEDGAIAQMEIGEPLDNEIDSLNAQRAAALEDLEAQRMKLTTILANAEAELEQAKIDRVARVEGISAETLELYETKRRQGGGVGAARLAKGGTCDGCNLTLARADYDTLKHTPADEMIFCPECDRILIR